MSVVRACLHPGHRDKRCVISARTCRPRKSFNAIPCQSGYDVGLKLLNNIHTYEYMASFIFFVIFTEARDLLFLSTGEIDSIKHCLSIKHIVMINCSFDFVWNDIC